MHDGEGIGFANPPRRVGGQRLNARRAARVTMPQGHHGLAARMRLRQLNGLLVRLRTRIGEEALLQPSRRDARKPLGQPRLGLDGEERARMLKRAHLRDRALRDLLVAVPHRDGHDAAEEIQVLATVSPFEVEALARDEGKRILVMGAEGRKEELALLGDDLLAGEVGFGLFDGHTFPLRSGPCRRRSRDGDRG
ncbi:hypothetical protein D3C87_964390 [compost metagenome]